MRGDEVYLTAYARLSTERRPFPNGVGPIPWSAVDAYARRSGFSPLVAEFFINTVMLLDSAFRAHIREQDEEADRKAKRTADRQARREAQKAGIKAVVERRQQGR